MAEEAKRAWGRLMPLSIIARRNNHKSYGGVVEGGGRIAADPILCVMFRRVILCRSDAAYSLALDEFYCLMRMLTFDGDFFGPRRGTSLD